MEHIFPGDQGVLFQPFPMLLWDFMVQWTFPWLLVTVCAENFSLCCANSLSHLVSRLTLRLTWELFFLCLEVFSISPPALTVVVLSSWLSHWVLASSSQSFLCPCSYFFALELSPPCLSERAKHKFCKPSHVALGIWALEYRDFHWCLSWVILCALKNPLGSFKEAEMFGSWASWFPLSLL